MALKSATAPRRDRFRDDPLDALAFELDWMGVRVVDALAPGSRRDAAVGAWRALLYRGNAVECPCCGGTFRKFLPDARGRLDVVCPRCQSQERHRALALYLAREPRLSSVLHFAPEPALIPLFRGAHRYVTCDLASPLATVHADIAHLPFDDASFELAIVSHVLEHVEDDRAAISEVMRVLAPGGRALVLSPVDFERADTYEDPAIVAPEDRERAFWQTDHVRLYGRDLPERLRSFGCRVEVDRFVAELGDAAIARHALSEDDEIYVCRR